MKLYHHKIEPKEWELFSKKEQLLNIASELCRIYQAELRENNKSENIKKAYERALELIDLTLEDPKWRGHSELYQFRDAISALYIDKADPSINNFFYNWLINLSQNI